MFVVAAAPLAAGLVRRFKALLQGRVGPPVLLPYWTLATLARKETVLSASTSWVFRLAPVVVLASALLTAFVLPLVSRGGAGAPLSHLVVVAGLWMLGAVFLVLAGIDSASAFGGMGASREMTISAFLEPAVIVTLSAFAAAAGLAHRSRHARRRRHGADRPSVAAARRRRRSRSSRSARTRATRWTTRRRTWS